VEFDGIQGFGLGVHHVGLTVSDLDAALSFWEGFLGRPAKARLLLERKYTQELVGIPGVKIQAAFIDIGDGSALELLAYQTDVGASLPPQSNNPGHVHLCLKVTDMDSAYGRAEFLGGQIVSKDGPVLIDSGPNVGTRAVYMRVPPDFHTVELFQVAGPVG
jgi:catechol 2,3-dioxygenase-like lactoylglutathione lyase family enzyme